MGADRPPAQNTPPQTPQSSPWPCKGNSAIFFQPPSGSVSNHLSNRLQTYILSHLKRSQNLSNTSLIGYHRLMNPTQCTVSFLDSLPNAQLFRLARRVVTTLAVGRLLFGRCLMVIDSRAGEVGCSGGIHYAILQGVDAKEALGGRGLRCSRLLLPPARASSGSLPFRLQACLLGGLVTQRAVGPGLVVMLPVVLQDHLGLQTASKDLTVEHLIP